jgi:hypothetical protein
MKQSSAPHATHATFQCQVLHVAEAAAPAVINESARSAYTCEGGTAHSVNHYLREQSIKIHNSNLRHGQLSITVHMKWSTGSCPQEVVHTSNGYPMLHCVDENPKKEKFPSGEAAQHVQNGFRVKLVDT